MYSQIYKLYSQIHKSYFSVYISVGEIPGCNSSSQIPDIDVFPVTLTMEMVMLRLHVDVPLELLEFMNALDVQDIVRA